MSMTRFGTLIRQKRLEMGLSLQKAAGMIRTYKGYICGIEMGTLNPPSPRMTERIAKAYKMDEASLILLGYVEKAPAKIREELRRRVYPPLKIGAAQ
jgi:transcriptional regulator with XRE-family HTH domain